MVKITDKILTEFAFIVVVGIALTYFVLELLIPFALMLWERGW